MGGGEWMNEKEGRVTVCELGRVEAWNEILNIRSQTHSRQNNNRKEIGFPLHHPPQAPWRGSRHGGGTSILGVFK